MRINNALSLLEIEEKNGLVWLTKPEYAINDAERLALVEAQRFRAYAVYFRRFDNGLHSINFLFGRKFGDFFYRKKAN